VTSGDPEAGLVATLLAALGVGGGGFYRVAHKQSELAARVDRLDEDRKNNERQMEVGRERLEEVRQTVTKLDSKVDTIIELVRRDRR
jgi:uncharacterized protein HemX